MISVILAARNEERLIGRAIRSVLAQTQRELELLVIDNGSTDATIEIAADFARQDPRVRIVHESEPGAYAARNRGVREAAGDLIAIQDADDVSHPERLARLSAHVARHPATVAVGSWALCYSESEGWREPFYHATSDRAIRSQLRVGPAPFIHSAVLFRR
jgi:glycosyltransferase involved in cell wall biosynthesis